MVIRSFETHKDQYWPWIEVGKASTSLEENLSSALKKAVFLFQHGMIVHFIFVHQRIFKTVYFFAKITYIFDKISYQKSGNHRISVNLRVGLKCIYFRIFHIFLVRKDTISAFDLQHEIEW